MKNKRSALTHLMISLMVLWGCVTVALFALLDKTESVIVVLLLAGFIGVAAVASPFRASGKVAAVLSIIYFLAFKVFQLIAANSEAWGGSLTGILSSPQALTTLGLIILGLVCLAVLGVLADAAIRRIRWVESMVDQHATAVEELTLRDSLTGTLKGNYADRILGQEMERSRRYNRSFSLVLLSADDWPRVVRERGESESMQVLKTIGDVLLKAVRNVDTVARGEESRFLIVLPETQLAGAHISAERLCRDIIDKTSVQYRAGIAEFPSDAVSKTELVNEAEAALSFARTAGVTLASSGALR